VIGRYAGAVLLNVVLGGCVGEDVDADEGILASDGFPEEVLGTIEPVRGYYKRQSIELYDLGTLKPGLNSSGEFAGMPVHPMYLLTRDGQVLGEQHPIVDTSPPASDYSPFFQIVHVEAASWLDPNEIKSQATLLRNDLPRTFTDQVVHCPLIAADAEVLPSGAIDAASTPRIELWFRKRRAVCLLLEGGVAFGSDGLPPAATDTVQVGGRLTYTIPAQDVYVPEVRIFDVETEVPGNLVTERIPGDPGYSPVARVSEVVVRPTYQVGAFDELADIDPTLIEPRIPETFLDLPLLGVVE
jgi:hypothetical protein